VGSGGAVWLKKPDKKSHETVPLRPIIPGHNIFILLNGHFTIYKKQFSISKAGQ